MDAPGNAIRVSAVHHESDIQPVAGSVAGCVVDPIKPAWITRPLIPFLRPALRATVGVSVFCLVEYSHFLTS